MCSISNGFFRKEIISHIVAWLECNACYRTDLQVNVLIVSQPVGMTNKLEMPGKELTIHRE
jgi:hypothetical protein